MSLLEDDGDDFVHLSLSDSESASDFEEVRAASTTPTTPRKIRPSELKSIPCIFEGCEKTFNRQARLDEHVNSHKNTRPYKCPQHGCDKDFNRETHVKRHIKSAHSEVRDYECSWDDCDKSFATGTRLRRHEAAHEKKEMFRCKGYKGCNKTFRKHNTLNNHILLEHKQQKPFACSEVDSKTNQVCESKFETAEKLRVHQRTKHDETRFSCETCRKSLAPFQSGDLVADHEDDQIVVAFFSTFAELQQHISAVHPPGCPKCLSAFISNKELRTHVELVHGIFDPSNPPSATFVCTEDDCGRIFSKKGNLNVHIKTVHENRKDFVCGKTENFLDLFESYGTLGVRGNLEIDGCGQAFTSKASLQEHVRTTHLGLSSRRAERNKRKEQTLAEDPTGEQSQIKRRKSRKGQGKKSALSALTGAPRDFELVPAYPAPSHDECEEKEAGPSYFGDEEEEDGEEVVSEVGFSGLETMYDGEIYGQDLTWSGHLGYGPLGCGRRGSSGLDERGLSGYSGRNDAGYGGHESSAHSGQDSSRRAPYGPSTFARIQQIYGHANNGTSSTNGNIFLDADHLPTVLDPQLLPYKM